MLQGNNPHPYLASGVEGDLPQRHHPPVTQILTFGPPPFHSSGYINGTSDLLNSNCLTFTYRLKKIYMWAARGSSTRAPGELERKSKPEPRCQPQRHSVSRWCQYIEKERLVEIFCLVWSFCLVINIMLGFVLLFQDPGSNFRVWWTFYQWQLGQIYWEMTRKANF